MNNNITRETHDSTNALIKAIADFRISLTDEQKALLGEVDSVYTELKNLLDRMDPADIEDIEDEAEELLAGYDQALYDLAQGGCYFELLLERDEIRIADPYCVNHQGVFLYYQFRKDLTTFLNKKRDAGLHEGYDEGDLKFFDRVREGQLLIEDDPDVVRRFNTLVAAFEEEYPNYPKDQSLD